MPAVATTLTRAGSSTFLRNTNLDALRAIAVFMVLFRHAGMAISLAHASTAFTRYGEQVGWAGVDLFFVLSGFLISGLLFAEYQNRRQIDVGRFYIRRGLKIWPAFLALIISGLIVDVVRHHFSTKGLWVELLFVQDYFFGIWGITWSLAVEEHFYLALPVVLLMMIRRKPEKPFAAMPYLFLAVAVLALSCRFAVGWSQDGTVDSWTCIFPTHLRMDGLLFGVLLCYYQKFRPNVFKRIVTWSGSWVLIASAIIILSVFPIESRQMHTWGFTVVYMAGGILVGKAVASEGPLAIRVVSRWLARVGMYSYSIYLWHMFFIWRVLPVSRIKAPMGIYWCSIIGPVLFGIAAARIIEVPVLSLRDRFFPRTSSSEATLSIPVSRIAVQQAG